MNDEFKNQVKAKLLANCEDVVRHLLPNGKKSSGAWKCGDALGAPGKSLDVNLDKGLWMDRATGVGGDLLGLWAINKGLPFVEALHDAARYVGMSPIKRTPPAKPKGYSQRPLGSMRKTPEMEHLALRGLKETVLQEYNVRTHTVPPGKYENTRFIAYQYETSSGERAFCKATGINRTKDGKKEIWSSPPFYTLWGWNTVKPNDTECLITEGEEDAMSVRQMLQTKIPCFSVPAGASNLNWIDNDLEALQQFDKIYLVLDSDDAGEECAKKVASRLGKSRCFRVTLPEGYKDCNEVLVRGPDSVRKPDEWLAAAETYDPPSLKKSAAVTESTMKMINEKKVQMHDSTFAFDVPFVQLDGEITILQGYPGHAKSDASYQMALNDLHAGKKTLFCSMEIPATEIQEALAWQMNLRAPKADDMPGFERWCEGRLFLLDDEDGVIKWKTLLGDLEYAVQRFGVQRIYIDSLHFLVDKQDWEGQDNLVRSLKKFAQKFKVHCTLIAHSSFREGGEYKMPQLDSVEGSKGMVKVVHNLLCMWRNIKKEESMDPKSEMDAHERVKYTDQPDAYIKCWKQRNGHRKRFTQGLWFDVRSRTFRTEELGRVRALREPDIRAEQMAMPPRPRDDEENPF